MKSVVLRHVSEPSWAGDERVRRAFAAIAGTLPGLAYPDPAYERAILPFDPPGILDAEARTMFSCGLTLAYGIWLPLGVDAPEIHGRYVPGAITTWIESIARRHNALLAPSLELQVGYAVVVAEPVHVVSIVGVEPDRAVTVEGGKGPTGHAIDRGWRPKPYTASGEIMFAGRKMLYLVDVTRLPLSGPALVPDDFDETIAI